MYIGDAGKRAKGAEEKDANRELPVDHVEEFALEDVQFADGYAADFGVDAIATEGVAETFAGYRDGGDYEAVAGERREDEDRHPRGYLIDVVQGY